MTLGPDSDARLTELEVKLSFAEDLIEILNATVSRQQRHLELIQAELRALHRQLQALGPVEERDLRDDIPPHY